MDVDSVRQLIIHKHAESMRELEAVYVQYIQDVLQQKAWISHKLNNDLESKLSTLNAIRSKQVRSFSLQTTFSNVPAPTLNHNAIDIFNIKAVHSAPTPSGQSIHSKPQQVLLKVLSNLSQSPAQSQSQSVDLNVDRVDVDERRHNERGRRRPSRTYKECDISDRGASDMNDGEDRSGSSAYDIGDESESERSESEWSQSRDRNLKEEPQTKRFGRQQGRAWTKAEIAKLLKLGDGKEESGMQWDDIAKRFKDRSAQAARLKYDKLSVRPTLQCTGCDLSFRYKSLLRKHQRSMACKGRQRQRRREETGYGLDVEEEPAKCPECNRKFQKKKYMLMHYESMHVELKPYLCSVAGCCRKFKTRDDLDHHQQKQHGR